MNAGPRDPAGPTGPSSGARLGPTVGPCSPDCAEHLEHVYVICYGCPVQVRDRDHLVHERDRDYPIDHYVGFTRQQPPIRRVRRHGHMSARHLAALLPGTLRDEEELKRTGRCPHCGSSLWYYSLPPR